MGTDSSSKGLCLPSSFQGPSSTGSGELLPQGLKPQPKAKAAEPLKKPAYLWYRPRALSPHTPAQPNVASWSLLYHQQLPGKEPSPTETLTRSSCCLPKTTPCPFTNDPLPPPPAPRLPFSPSSPAMVLPVSLAHTSAHPQMPQAHVCPEASHYPRSRLASTFCTHSSCLLWPRWQIPCGKP